MRPPHGRVPVGHEPAVLGLLSGMTQNVSASRGWAVIANPKSVGRSPVISCQVAAPSSER